jgi:DHA2 family multidrug resistance protein
VTANSDIGQTYISAQAAAAALRSGGDLVSNQAAAFAQLSRTVQQQATVITYSDCFWILGVAMLAMIPLTFLLRVPSGPAGSPAAAH